MIQQKPALVPGLALPLALLIVIPMVLQYASRPYLLTFLILLLATMSALVAIFNHVTNRVVANQHRILASSGVVLKKVFKTQKSSFLKAEKIRKRFYLLSNLIGLGQIRIRTKKGVSPPLGPFWGASTLALRINAKMKENPVSTNTPQE